jgi:hypothetical protein
MVAPTPLRAHDDAPQIAEAIVSRWREIDAALSPIVGSRGVATLYRRCVFLAGKTHPWLVHDQPGDAPTLDLPALHALLATRESAEAHAAGQLLLATFTDLIGRLIGASLAERLLNAHRAPTARGSAAQDLPT